MHLSLFGPFYNVIFLVTQIFRVLGASVNCSFVRPDLFSFSPYVSPLLIIHVIMHSLESHEIYSLSNGAA
jgi:uncharacterized membrane protein